MKTDIRPITVPPIYSTTPDYALITSRGLVELTKDELAEAVRIREAHNLTAAPAEIAIVLRYARTQG